MGILLKRRYQRKAKRGVRRTARKPKVSLPVKRYVKRALHQNTENKLWIDFYLNVPIASAVGAVPSNIALLPQLSQGTAQNQRVGNKVKVRRAYVKGYCNLLPYNVTNNINGGPILVKLFVIKYKKQNINTLSSTDITTQFFETGSGSTGFQGNVLDMLFQGNDSSWKICMTKQFELGTTSQSAFTGQYGTSYNDNSKMTIPFYFNYTKHLKKTLLYQDSSTSVCQNDNLWLAFQAVYADGTSILVQGAEYHAVNRVEYEDA